MQKDPLIVLDGAHNEASAGVLAKTLAGFKAAGKLILVLGVSRDKDIKGICGALAPLCQECIITMADNPRALEASKIAQVLKEYSPNIRVSQTRTVPAAVKDALGGACRNDLIVVTGSLFIVGEAREFLKKKEASAG
jgi:dihydrofolate synthase/folylpolyglutamate synthase